MVKEKLPRASTNVGSRIRARRLDLGIRQADLAQDVGISPSYLNLIEHNRRRIGGRLLTQMAEKLGVDASQLAQGARSGLIETLLTAAARTSQKAETERVEEMAARYPGWAALLAEQYKHNEELTARLRDLNDRMSSDPELARSLHAVISAVTSIRSTSAILTSDETLDADWQRRFHGNIHQEAIRLAELSEGLVAAMDPPDEPERTSEGPMAEASSWLAERRYHIAELEAGAATPAEIEAISELTAAGASRLRVLLDHYAKNARDMPLERFGAAAKEADWDPTRMAGFDGIAADRLLHRLASLPTFAGHPETGLVECDASGTVTFLKPVEGVSLPTGRQSCPLWPLFAALGQPGRPVVQDVALPNAAGGRLRCYAVALPQLQTDFGMAPVLTSTMLVQPDAPDSDRPPFPVGVSCRICPRQGCQARREPEAVVLGRRPESGSML